MAKASKQILPYRLGRLPNNLDEILEVADTTDLKILIALQMAADAEGVIDPMPDLRESLGLESPEIEKSLKFWRVAGILTTKRGSEKATPAEKPKEIEENNPKKPTRETAHRNGAVVHHGVVDYNTEELGKLLERRAELAGFVTEAQRVLGKTINYHDTSLLVGLVEQLGFEIEAVLAVVAYAVRRGRATVKYAEKIAISLYDEGLTQTAEVEARIHTIEQSAEAMTQIKNMFGIVSRALSTTEKKLFTKWIETYGFELAVIRMAYDITIDAIHTPAPKYADKILEKWYNEGLRTARDIEEFERARKSAAGKNAEGKSYDLDDFFEASLKRSYEIMEEDLK